MSKITKLSVFLLCISVLSACTFSRNNFIDYEISEAVTLNQEWWEISPKESLKVERDTQEILLSPNPPIQMKTGDNGKLIPVDGRSATLEAELIDSNGTIYRSSPGVSEGMTGDLKITSRSLTFKNLPHDAVLTKVRIKSSSPYPVEKIIWRCYNWAEVSH